MQVKFSVDRTSPAGPMIAAAIRSGPFAQTVLFSLEAARDLYRDLGDALVDAGKAPGPAEACAVAPRA